MDEKTKKSCIHSYQLSEYMIKVLLGDEKGIGANIFMGTMFGYHGYNFFIWTDHIQLLKEVNMVIKSKEGMLDSELVNRWKLLNELFIVYFEPPEKLSEIIRKDCLNISAMVAYPLLEEVARKISNAWDGNGKLLKCIPEGFGLTRRDSKGKIVKHSYKEGHTIVLLSHKLELMKLSLDPGFQEALDSLSRRMQMSFIQGTNQLMSSLFERLEFHRNQWSHGRKYDGWEAILISLILCLLYFRPSDEEVEKYKKNEFTSE